jgi:hypothetical protein
VNNRTAYELDEKTMRFKQTDYLASMITRTRKACAGLLQQETISQRFRVGREVFPEGTSLYQLLESAEVHPGNSQEIFEMFLLEMTQPGRYFHILTLTNIALPYSFYSIISTPSQYRVGSLHRNIPTRSSIPTDYGSHSSSLVY